MPLPALTSELPNLISSYGYGAVAGIVALESMGIPFPGETALIAAAIIAGTAHTLDIWLVIAAAAMGAIIGDNIGFWIGRQFGFWLLVRYGRYIGLSESRIKLGQYAFLRHGGKFVFFGRFVALLRVLAAPLAGANAMPWPSFLAFNAAGAFSWTMLYGFGAYYLGNEVTHVAKPAAIAIGAGAVIAFIVSAIFVRRHEAALQARAEQALPGPIRRRPWRR